MTTSGTTSLPLPRRTILAICCLAMITIAFGLAAPSICNTAISAELHMDSVQQGMFLSSGCWGLTIAILIAGPLADRCGFRILMFAGSILQATGMVIISQAVSPWQAWAGGFIVGMGSGIADAIVSPLVCAIYPERRTRMTGLAHAFYAIGVVVTVLLVLGLLNAGWPWRRAFVVLAALALPWGVISLFVRLPSQSHAGTERLPARQVVRRGAFWLLMLAIFFGGVTEIGPSSWLPTFVEKATPGSRNAGGLGLLAFGLTLAVGRLGVSAIIHRIGARRMFALGGLLCMLSLVMAALAASTGGTVFWLTALGLGVAGFWPTIVGCAGDRFPQAGASMFSLLAATGNFGGVVGPMLIGLLADGLGLRTAMALLAIAPAAVMILMVTLLRKQARSGA